MSEAWTAPTRDGYEIDPTLDDLLRRPKVGSVLFDIARLDDNPVEDCLTVKQARKALDAGRLPDKRRGKIPLRHFDKVANYAEAG